MAKLIDAGFCFGAVFSFIPRLQNYWHLSWIKRQYTINKLSFLYQNLALITHFYNCFLMISSLAYKYGNSIK